MATSDFKIWKQERKVISLTLQIEVLFLLNISPPYTRPPFPPNIGPSNLSLVRLYAKGVLAGFYGIVAELTLT